MRISYIILIVVCDTSRLKLEAVGSSETLVTFCWVVVCLDCSDQWVEFEVMVAENFVEFVFIYIPLIQIQMTP